MVNTLSRAAGYLLNGCANPVSCVVENEVYRSGQLSGKELGGAIEKYGLRSIINLRGSHPDKKWYQDEVEAASMHGVAIASRPISSKKPNTPADLARIMDDLEFLPKPILVHCWGGSDRTGLISAFVKLKEGKRNEAREQMSLRFLYLGWGKSRICGDIVNSACSYNGTFDQWFTEEYPNLYTALIAERDSAMTKRGFAASERFN